MWKKIVGLVAMICVMAFSTAALAQAAGAAGGYLKKRVFDFEGDDIEGSLLSPDGKFMTGDTGIKFKTLIEYRFDFVPEMVKSAEDI